MKIAIIYDWIDKWGGAERILKILFEEFNQADIYTIYADYKIAKWADKYKKRIKTTFIQELQRVIPFKQLLAPLMPMAVESLYLSDYDIVFSISSAFVKGVITRPETKHISYLFTPTRFLWHERNKYISSNILLKPITTFLREWDYIAGQKPDEIITLSKHSQYLIKKVYQRESKVVYPPFEIKYWEKIKKQIKKNKKISSKFKNLKNNEYYLVVTRLEPYKKIELVIKAFNQLKKEKLIIVGFGMEIKKLQKIANKNIRFIKYVSDQDLGYLYKGAKALIMPQAEDFGYTALESLFFHTPVISYRKSGVAEIITNYQNGILFNEQTVESLLAGIEKSKLHVYNFNHKDLNKFNKDVFIKNLRSIIRS